jgi:hypothetical protein
MEGFVKGESGLGGVEVSGEAGGGTGSDDDDEEEEEEEAEEADSSGDDGGVVGGAISAAAAAAEAPPPPSSEGDAAPLAPLCAAQIEELLACAEEGRALPAALSASLAAAGLLPAEAGCTAPAAPPPRSATAAAQGTESLRDVMAAQDAALFAASPDVLAASFPRAGGAWDAERSLVGAAAEGVAAQGGAAGPLTTLMMMGGVEVPNAWW